MKCKWCGLALPIDQPFDICECCAADGITKCQVCNAATDAGAVCRECGAE